MTFIPAGVTVLGTKINTLFVRGLFVPSPEAALYHRVLPEAALRLGKCSTLRRLTLSPSEEIRTSISFADLAWVMPNEIRILQAL